MELQNAELQATCAALGYVDGDTYHKEPDCLESIKDLIVFLRRDEESCDRRRQLGDAQILQTDLIPIIKQYKDDKILLETVIRLLVNLTQPAKLCFQNHIPEDKITLSYYLQVESHLQSYKEAFADEALVAVLTKKLGDLLSLTWENRQEEDRLLIERILLVIRNILHIAPNSAKEMRTDDDASIHDQVLWALHVSGMEDLLLYLASSEDERQFAFHVLEIVSLMFREQTAAQLARAGAARAAADKDADERELESVLQNERSQRLMKMMKTNKRRSMFTGTFVVTNVKAISESQLICHKPLETITDNVNFDENKKPRKRPKNRRVILDPDVSRRSTLSIRLFLKDFCIQFMTHCYNPLMRSVKDTIVRSRSDQHDETYYLWAMRFFMEFNRVHDFRVEFVSETISFTMFHYVQTHLQTYLEMVQANKKEAIIWSKRMHLALQAYNELLLTLKAMSSSKDENVRESATVIKNNVFYTMEYREILIVLFRSFNETKQSRSYLRDLICCTHLFHKMLEHFCKGTRHFVVQKKKRKVKRRKKKTGSIVQGEMSAEDLESAWDRVSGELSALLQGREPVPEGVVPFDAASSVDIDQQRINAMCKVQQDLRLSSPGEAVALLRAAREVWPDRNEFGSADISAEEEFMALREIFFAPLPQNTEQEAVGEEEEYDEEEIEVEEEIEDVRIQNVEQEFSLAEYISRFATPQVVKACMMLLTTFDQNAVETNHSIVKLLHRIAYDCQYIALLFQASLFRIFQKLLSSPEFNTRHYKELREFARHILAKFFSVAQNNSKVFVELFFWKSQKEAYEISEGYGTTQKKSSVRQTWTEDQDDELRRLYDEFKDDPQQDIVDQIMTRLTDQTKSRRQVLRQLVMLNIIGSAKDLQKRIKSTGNRGPRQWREEEELQLRELFLQFQTSDDPVGNIISNMAVPRSKRTVIQKMLDLGIVSSKAQLHKKRSRKQKKSGGQSSDENSDLSDSDAENNTNILQRGRRSDIETSSDDDAAILRFRTSNTQRDNESSDNESEVQRTKVKTSVEKSSANVKFSGTSKVKQLVAATYKKGLSGAVEWLKNRLMRTADEREEDVDDESVPLVPLTEDQDEALEDSTFRALLKSCSIKPPADQERYWRIPNRLSPNQLRTFAADLIFDSSIESSASNSESQDQTSARIGASPSGGDFDSDHDSSHSNTEPRSKNHADGDDDNRPAKGKSGKCKNYESENLGCHSNERDNGSDDNGDDEDDKRIRKFKALEELLNKRKAMVKRTETDTQKTAGAATTDKTTKDRPLSSNQMSGSEVEKSSDEDQPMISSSKKRAMLGRKRVTIASDDESGKDEVENDDGEKKKDGAENLEETDNLKLTLDESDDDEPVISKPARKRCHVVDSDEDMDM